MGSEARPDAPAAKVAAKAEVLAAKGFGTSLIARAQRRVEAVDQVDLGGWVVRGDPALGDSQAVYHIRFDGTRYHCSCYQTYYGDVRRSHLCSHVLAVQLWRSAHPVPPVQSAMWYQHTTTPWPDWVESFRPHQYRACQEIVRHFRGGKKVVFLEAPTGSGKTLIAEMVRRLMGERATYLCVTKSLQDQVEEDFPYGRVLKGRANYPTLDEPERFWPHPDRLSAADCDKSQEYDEEGKPVWVCSWCSFVSQCPYEVAKREALAAELCICNVAYFLTEANGPGRMSKQDLVIVDEADEMESEIMRHLEVEVPAKWQRRLRLGRPDRVTMPEHWETWIKRAIPKIQTAIKTMTSEPETLQTKRDIRSLERLLKNLENLQGKLQAGSWVYTGEEEVVDEKTGFKITFKPVTVADVAEDKLWRHGKQWLLMSATIISAQQMAEDLGLQPDEWALVSVPSTFPKDRRPIYVLAEADLSRDHEESDWTKAVAAVDRILDRYAGYRTLIHTVSKFRAKKLIQHSRHQHRMWTYSSAEERQQAIQRLEATPNGVLVAPSLERGVDLPDDLCRCVIILKVPWPDYGDRQIRARLKLPGGRGWYTVQTIRSLVQMTGRGMRHAQDWADSYIIDKQFVELWKRNRGLIPAWWKEAIWWGDKRTPVGVQDQAGD